MDASSHSRSNQCSKTELDLFTLNPTQTVIKESIINTISPITSILNTRDHESPIDFILSSGGELYHDISNLHLELKGKIVTDHTGGFAAGDSVYPVKSLLNTLFSDIDVIVNDVLITSSTGLHPYRALIEQELSFSQDAKTSHLTSGGYYYDKTSYEKSYSDAGTAGKDVNLYGKLHLDIVFQPRTLPGGINIKLRLHRKKPSFYLIANDSASQKEPYLRLDEATIYIKKYRLAPPAFLDIERSLLKHRAVYPMKNVQVRCIPLNPQMQTYNIPNILIGKLPDKIVLALCDHQSMTGSYKTDPLRFDPFDLSSIRLYIDGKEEGMGFNTNYKNRHLPDCIRAFKSITEILSVGNEGNGISLHDYVNNGLTLYGFDLTQDLSGGCCTTYENLIRRGNLSIKLSFASMLTTTLNLVMYLEFKEYLEIDNKRRVYKTL